MITSDLRVKSVPWIRDTFNVYLVQCALIRFFYLLCFGVLNQLMRRLLCTSAINMFISMKCRIFIFLKTVLVEHSEWFFRLSATSLLVISYLVYYSDFGCCSQMRRQFLKLNWILSLYLVLLMKAVVATKVHSFLNSFIHSFISLWGLWFHSFWRCHCVTE
jgi:hypothetical protein